ncbi:MAG: Ger(x)C family spore germination C-terminal domain-containing protein [Clostridia bacterium]
MEFLKKHTWLVVVIAIILVMPQALTTHAILNQKIILSGIAVDKESDIYEVTAQVILPKGGSQISGTGINIDFISEQGKTVGEAIQKIGYKMGKTVSLSHINFIILGEGVMKDNIATDIDYFYRSASINVSAMILGCTGKGGDMIKKTQGLETDIAVGLQKAFIYKQHDMNGIMTTMQEVYNSLYNPSQTIMISMIEFEMAKSSGGDAGTNSGGGASGTSRTDSENQQTTRIKYYNDIAILKAGKVVSMLTQEDEILGVILQSTKSKEGAIGFNNVEIENADIGKLTLMIKNKRTKYKTYFENGTPIFEINIIIDKCLVSEIQIGTNNKEIYESTSNYLNENLTKVATTAVTSYIYQAFKQGKENDADILGIADKFSRLKAKEWQSYQSKLSNKNNYLNEVNIVVNLKIRQGA